MGQMSDGTRSRPGFGPGVDAFGRNDNKISKNFASAQIRRPTYAKNPPALGANSEKIITFAPEKARAGPLLSSLIRTDA